LGHLGRLHKHRIGSLGRGELGSHRERLCELSVETARNSIHWLQVTGTAEE
jgi:hypothetical protein